MNVTSDPQRKILKFFQLKIRKHKKNEIISAEVNHIFYPIMTVKLVPLLIMYALDSGE